MNRRLREIVLSEIVTNLKHHNAKHPELTFKYETSRYFICSQVHFKLLNLLYLARKSVLLGCRIQAALQRSLLDVSHPAVVLQLESYRE